MLHLLEYLPVCIQYVFVAATLFQVLFWLGIFRKLAYYEPVKTPSKPEKSLSIVMAARNEAKNIKKNFDRIVNQNYRLPEIIVANDNSTDETEAVLLEYMKKCSYLRIINNVNELKKGNKKRALANGIRAAKNDWILVTDADCRPASENWAKKMQEAAGGDTEIVLGYAPYDTMPGFLNKFIRFETIFTATQYLSMALMKMPYMGVGRNMLYKKQLFEKTGGFDAHLDVLSGDDDLFVNEVAHRGNVAIQIDPETFVYSCPKTTWGSYYRQKARHLSSSKHYKRRHQIILGLFSMSHFVHYLGGFVLIILNFSTIFVTILYGIRMLILLWLFGRILAKLKDKSLLLSIPLLDATYSLYYLIFSQALIFNKRKWN